MSYEIASGPISATGGVSKRPRSGIYAAFGKRVCDLVFAFALLPILVPVIAILWGLTRLDGGPGFFGHKRVGKDRRQFSCWKIRTMVPDAEAKLKQYLSENPDAKAQWQRDFKLDNDPRITRLGNFLRKTSLDELPQIWNVIRGEMSFVGPRPVVQDELLRYGESEKFYLSVRPGITGLWQVSGRNDISYADRVRMDRIYASRYSMLQDTKIIAKTATVVLFPTGK
ncbi:MAG: exopolysaccharide biosynthesis protein [Rhodovulum sp.]|nr:exopolysaccharide biosynthesis protein [Rhodovulum sp.]